jgi:Tfp pilus assembly protein PilO
MLEENQRLSRVLADAEDKLRESNFQRQQLLKKVGFLEELNKDLQQVAEHNKKLENQLRRLSEIENMMLKMPGNTKI